MRSLLEFVLPIPFHRLKLDLGQFHAGGVILQPTVYLISRFYRADTGRRSCQDQITWLEEGERLVARLGQGEIGRDCGNSGDQGYGTGFCPGVPIYVDSGGEGRRTCDGGVGMRKEMKNPPRGS